MNSSMKNIRWIAGTVLLGAILIFGVQGISIAVYKKVNPVAGNGSSEAQFVLDGIYVEECGACHIAYPPGLLPVTSWNKIMEGLEDHFGDNAELDKETNDYLGLYLNKNSLKKSKPSSMSRMLRNMPEHPPIRITQLPQFQADHSELFVRLKEHSDKELTVSQCEDCHGEAQNGVFKKVQLPAEFSFDKK